MGCSSSSWSNLFNSDPNPLTTSNHQYSSTSSPHPSTASIWSNTFNSDQTSSTSSPHPLTASPIAPQLHVSTHSTVIPIHQLMTKVTYHQSSSTSTVKSSSVQSHTQLQEPVQLHGPKPSKVMTS